MNSPSPKQVLQAIKSLITHDPSTTDPHHILVQEHHKILFDSKRFQPARREEVMEPLPKFGSRGPSRYDYPNGQPAQVADRLRPYTSLIKRLSARVFAQIDRIEAALIMDDCLPGSVRSSHRARLKALTNSAHPVWENWLLSLDAHGLRYVDKEIDEWLKEPIDWDEKPLFRDGWDDAFYAAKAANEFFGRIHPKVREYLGVGVGSFRIEGQSQSLNLYVLAGSVEEANSRAKGLGLKFRFKAW